MTTKDFTFCSLDAPFNTSSASRWAAASSSCPSTRPPRPRSGTRSPPKTEPNPTSSSANRQRRDLRRNDDDQDGSDGDPSARTFYYSWDAWTDGERLLVTDYDNHRVLLWNDLPHHRLRTADVVIGQDSMTTGNVGTGATGLDLPYTVASNGNQMLIGDFRNNRVLVYNAFPTSNGAAADAVLGQATFANTTRNDDDQDGVTDAGPLGAHGRSLLRRLDRRGRDDRQRLRQQPLRALRRLNVLAVHPRRPACPHAARRRAQSPCSPSPSPP
jgi:hypothetical protein